MPPPRSHPWTFETVIRFEALSSPRRAALCGTRSAIPERLIGCYQPSQVSCCHCPPEGLERLRGLSLNPRTGCVVILTGWSSHLLIFVWLWGVRKLLVCPALPLICCSGGVSAGVVRRWLVGCGR